MGTNVSVSVCIYAYVSEIIVVKIQGGQEEWGLQNVKISDRLGLHLHLRELTVCECVCVCVIFFCLIFLSIAILAGRCKHLSTANQDDKIFELHRRESVPDGDWCLLNIFPHLHLLSKATVIWDGKKTSKGASPRLNMIANYTLEP